MMNFSAVTCVLVTISVPCFAQGSRTSFSVTRQYVAADLVSNHVAIPDNLHVDAMYRPLLESMLERSPTFRRQCLRVASDPRLTVHLYPAGSTWTRGARAITHFVRGTGGGLDAEIYLTRLDDHVELIAHELEHVIEQLDQVDLSFRASLPDTGVSQSLSSDATFETTRAAQVGLRVAREVREIPMGN
jgi:hypothetical protein